MRKGYAISDMWKIYTYLLLFIPGLILKSQVIIDSAYTDYEDTSRIKIVRLNLNSKEEDFCPVLCNKKMLFTSARPVSFGVVYKEPGNEYNTNIYYADKKDSVNFSAPKLWPGNVNTRYNEGCAALNRE